MRNIGKGSSMDKGRGVPQGLDQVGEDGIPEQDRHCRIDTEVGTGQRLAVPGLAENDFTDPVPQIREAGGEAKHRHDFRGRGDIKAIFSRHAMEWASEADDNIAKSPVVEIYHSFPGDLRRGRDTFTVLKVLKQSKHKIQMIKN